jgi:hypothetical protein
MTLILAQILAVITGLAILLTLWSGGWGRGLKGFGVSIVVVIAAAIAIAVIRSLEIRGGGLV